MKYQKNKSQNCKKFLICSIFIAFFSFFILIAILSIIYENGIGHSQHQVDTLTEVNKQLENLMETIEDELSDNPELLNNVKEYLNMEINSNNTEIDICSGLLEKDRLYRWLIFFI